MEKYLHYLHDMREDMISETAALVRIETPTLDERYHQKAAGHLCDLLETRSRANVRITNDPHPHIIAEWGSGDKQILLAGHFDTVHAVGSLDINPCRREGNRLYGPGVCDMKAGIIQAVFALTAVHALTPALNKRVVCFFNCDEETGSTDSVRYIESLAKQSQCAFVLEPGGGPVSALRVERKGVGTYTLSAHGRASHAGTRPEEGVHAIEELCRQVLYLQELNNPADGVGVNCGLIRGGTAKNTIPAYAEAVIDVRAANRAAAKRMDQLIRSLTPFNTDVKLAVTGGITRPPMEQSRESRSLFDLAGRLMEGAGFEALPGIAVGGASDGNNLSQYIPVLDGLGAIGGGVHTDDEWIDTDHLVPRAALLAALIEYC